MADVISVTNSDSAFDASKGVTRTNLPPFAQRLRKAADLVWEEGYRQPFIRELGEGTLPREKFAFYLLQDFRYLNDYARVHALGLAKTDDPEIMAFMLNVQNGALNVESTVHRTYLASYGITDEQMNNVRQSAFARAYTSNILSIAYGKGILDILVAVLPCAWVYADYGYRLAHEFADTLDVNQYKSWVDMYKTGKHYDRANDRIRFPVHRHQRANCFIVLLCKRFVKAETYRCCNTKFTNRQKSENISEQPG